MRGEDPPADLADQILRVFSRHCEAPVGVPERPLFRLPFGPDSRRWMLTDNAPRPRRRGGTALTFLPLEGGGAGEGVAPYRRL